MTQDILTSKDIMEACATANPTLWRLFCAVCQRPVDSVSLHWTEQDVCTLLYSYAKEGRAIHLNQMREMTTNDAGRTTQLANQDTVVKFGHRDNIRRDDKASDIVAVGEASHSTLSGDHPKSA